MARPFYPHEAKDPDLDWLVSNFLCDRPEYTPIEAGMLPLVLVPHHEEVEEVKGEIGILSPPQNQHADSSSSSSNEVK